MERVWVEFDVSGIYTVYANGDYDSDHTTHESALRRFLELTNNFCVIVMESK